MNIPQSVKVGGIIYTVAVGEPRYNENGAALLGQVSYGNAEIYINEAQNDQVKVQTLLHEITHIILNMMGRKDLNEDEYFVDAVAYNLHQIIADNVWNINPGRC